MTTEQMAEAAVKRLNEWINRAAGQHVRAMKDGWLPINLDISIGGYIRRRDEIRQQRDM